MTEKQIKKLRCFIEYYGAGNQLVKAIEEFAELQQVLAKICTIPDSFKENTINTYGVCLAFHVTSCLNLGDRFLAIMFLQSYPAPYHNPPDFFQ